MIRIIYIGESSLGISRHSFYPRPEQVVAVREMEEEAEQYVQEQPHGCTYRFEEFDN